MTKMSLIRGGYENTIAESNTEKLHPLSLSISGGFNQNVTPHFALINVHVIGTRGAVVVGGNCHVHRQNRRLYVLRV
jgi:hypothetical protein